jgi:predicted HicB family RNase H-like nuclease
MSTNLFDSKGNLRIKKKGEPEASEVPTAPAAPLPIEPLKRPDVQVSKLRFPGTLHRQLKVSGAANGRSLNSEIVARLERSFLMEDVAAFLRQELQLGKS